MAYGNNYYNPNMMQNNPYGYMYQQQPQMPQQVQQPQVQQIPQQPAYRPNIGLQGKSVESLDVVKAIEIPLDGSISYFPLTDNSAIITKQLQMDGTSKTVIYKPVDLEDIPKPPKYITPDELDEAIKKVDNNSLKDDIKTIKRQIKDIIEDIKEIEERKD